MGNNDMYLETSCGECHETDPTECLYCRKHNLLNNKKKTKEEEEEEKDEI